MLINLLQSKGVQAEAFALACIVDWNLFPFLIDAYEFFTGSELDPSNCMMAACDIIINFNIYGATIKDVHSREAKRNKPEKKIGGHRWQMAADLFKNISTNWTLV